MREVLAEIGADKVPEIDRHQQGRRRRPDGDRAAARSASRTRSWSRAKTGEGIDDGAARASRPSCRGPGSSSRRCVPYERGDLLNRLHQHGEIDSLEHTGDGTLVRGRANADLAGELAAYAV